MKNKKIFHQELVGANCEIIGAKNASLKGMKGKIINETRNIITIKTSDGEKKAIKQQVTIMAEINNKKIRIEGTEIDARPEDRAKVN